MSKKQEIRDSRKLSPKGKGTLEYEELREVYARLQKPKNPAAPKMRRNGVRQG